MWPRRPAKAGAHNHRPMFCDEAAHLSFRGARLTREPGLSRLGTKEQDKLEIPDRRALRVVRNDGAYFTRSAAPNSALLSCPPVNTNRPPISGSTASASRPLAVEPVESLIQPIR